jgi:retinol-binding protein 3
MKSFAIILLFLLVSLVSPNNLYTQESLTENERSEMIHSLSRQLNENYVFPQTGKEMSEYLLSRLRSGDYKDLQDPMQFAARLTNDLQLISRDKHLRVLFAPERIAAMRNSTTTADSQAFVQRELEQNRRNNFGFREVKILEGNVAYIDLRGFVNTEFAGETAIAAMNYVSHADALIIDLRHNGGGSPSMIQLISSYLFDSQPVHLNSFYFRPADEYSETWTLATVSGKRRPDMDVYVLTSSNTFSAAEEFSYNLKNLGRATLIGETTGGGAHPGGLSIVTDRFLVWMPTGRAINPITNINWEGTGVEPHVKVDAEQALATAHVKALEVLAENNPRNSFHDWHLQKLRADQQPVSIPGATLRSYAGQYGLRRIIFEEGKLFYQREGQTKYPLKPLEADLLAIEDIPNFRIRIVRENGKISGIMGLYEDGREDFSEKN